MSSVETRIIVLEDRSRSTERQLVDVMMSNNRALEKANEAYGRAIEANSVAKATADKIRAVAQKAYTVLKMSGFSRSEFILVNDEPIMIEMNTIPGLTTESLIPQQAQVAGITLEDLFTNSIELALAKK